ncbi:hypothetical protein C5167_032113 [Papaver somniferum]|uniref:Thioredoxin domain-containing protein n=1 Tax=Papaver somniferum TaxID=3469 RepID=A0A4Y7K9G9_PAPSO|nr:hypothetical protein C5167_032113 [Papaver somniferum]
MFLFRLLRFLSILITAFLHFTFILPFCCFDIEAYWNFDRCHFLGFLVGRKKKERMSYLLPHLHSGWAVDQAILAEEERLVVIRFGHDWDETCMQMDEVLSSVAETIKNFAVIYLVDITEVPDFNTMYELYDPSTVMFFFRNKHIMIDLGTGNNNKINWALKDKQEFIDIIETVYRGARKGRGLVIAPKDYSTKYRY